ncbi:hypothetical protein OIU74_012154 [Salix koriyanagi]|uniref:Uncharacterized protein n=1 Tax=Salix koriyanagi TaxID=2511006 RepID=A0A9Q0Q680_9ROSI|nr:hypothetical protein OIU74_012154 [Salix koriyanagi]
MDGLVGRIIRCRATPSTEYAVIISHESFIMMGGRVTSSLTRSHKLHIWNKYSLLICSFPCLLVHENEEKGHRPRGRSFKQNSHHPLPVHLLLQFLRKSCHHLSFLKQ